MGRGLRRMDNPDEGGRGLCRPETSRAVGPNQVTKLYACWRNDVLRILTTLTNKRMHMSATTDC